MRILDIIELANKVIGRKAKIVKIIYAFPVFKNKVGTITAIVPNMFCPQIKNYVIDFEDKDIPASGSFALNEIEIL